MIKNFTQNEEGAIAPIIAVILPITLLMGAMILESGNYYLSYGQINFISYSAAQSGLIETGKVLKAKAESNYQALCSGLEPPPICSSNDWKKFISDTEITQILLNPTHQSTIQNHITNFINLPRNLENKTIEIEYPLGFNPGDANIQLQVTIEGQPKNYFARLLNQGTLQAQGLSYITVK